MTDEIHGPVASAPVILIVEDEILIRMALAFYLEEQGFQVIDAGDFVEARGILEKHFAISAIVSDVYMHSEADGITLARWVQEFRPSIPVLLATGTARPKEVSELS